MTASSSACRLAGLLSSAFAKASSQHSDALFRWTQALSSSTIHSLIPGCYSPLSITDPILPAANQSNSTRPYETSSQSSLLFKSSTLPAAYCFGCQTRPVFLNQSSFAATYDKHPYAVPTSICAFSASTNAQEQQQQKSSESKDGQPPPPQPQPKDSNQEDSIWTAPNLLSVGRAISGPFIAALILQDEWSWAVGATAIAGASDWADGALARRLGQTSVLGSYLDPLADKILVCCVVGALAAQGAAPTWVAVLVIGRDVGLVAGMALHRWRSLGWRTTGITASQFFSTQATGNAAGLPFMKPFLISKANTVLQLALVSSCMTHAWLQFPDAMALHNLEMVTAGTTVASLAAYAWAYATGKLLPVPKTP